ncbi:MAG: hypothetical protein P8Y21_15580 [Gemmatimonadales bacterium]
MNEVPAYSDRIAVRLAVWWQKPRNYRDPKTYIDYLHQLRERNTFRSRFDSDDEWQCCACWPRSLINKWNSREFALKHGCRVPELYWYGRDLRHVRLESLPDRYVIRQTFGSGKERVYVFCGGREVTKGRQIAEDEVRANLGGAFRSVVRGRILVEEFIGRKSGTCEMPLECKLFMFGDNVGMIEVFRRSHRRLAPKTYVEGLGLIEHGCYSAAWEPFEDPIFNTDYLMESYGHVPSTNPQPRPDFLPELIAAGKRLGLACGTHVRVDYLVGENGLVFFNEISTTPAIGALTPFADEYLGRLWQETFPDVI